MQSDNYKSTKKSSSKTSKSETTELIRPGKPYDEFTFDEFIPIGIVHCADCGVVMPGNQLETEDFGYAVPLCTSCNILRNGKFCYNCEETSTVRNFECHNSVLCDTCFNFMREPADDKMEKAVSFMKNRDKMSTITKKYDDKVRDIKSEINTLYKQIKAIKAQIEETKEEYPQHDSELYEKTKAIFNNSRVYFAKLIEALGEDFDVLDGHVESFCGYTLEYDLAEKTNLAEYVAMFKVCNANSARLAEVVKEGQVLQSKYSTKIAEYIRRRDDKHEDVDAKIKKLKSQIKSTKLQIETYTDKSKDLETYFKQKKTEVLGDATEHTADLLALIDSGMFSSEQIVEKLCGRSCTGNPIEMSLYKLFLSNFGVCSEAIRQLECAIQRGEDLQIKDLRKDDPVREFIKRYIVYCYQEQDADDKCKKGGNETSKSEKVLNHKKRVSARKLYDAYVKMCKKSKVEALCEKKFSEDVLELLEKKGVTKKKSGTMVYTGIALQEDDDNEDDSDEE